MRANPATAAKDVCADREQAGAAATANGYCWTLQQRAKVAASKQHCASKKFSSSIGATV